MGDLLVFVGIGFVLWCLGEGIVRIIRASSGGSTGKEVKDLQVQLADLEDELLDARKRIEVLESIVTDERHQLSKRIDELGS